MIKVLSMKFKSICVVLRFKILVGRSFTLMKHDIIAIIQYYDLFWIEIWFVNEGQTNNIKYIYIRNPMLFVSIATSKLYKLSELFIWL